jgi:hypothetical protein
MTTLEGIREKFQQNEYEFSEHAVYQSITRNISVQEVQEVIQTAELLEDYPDDKYGPSLLLLGFTHAQRPIHIQCSYPSRPRIKIITLYQPDPKKWLNYRIRR